MDIDQVRTTINRFISEKLLASGMKGYVVGLSGGIDSAVSTALAVEAVGAGKVFAVLMPYQSSPKESVADALKLVQRLGIEHRLVDITPMISAYFPSITRQNRLRAGNKMARERMSILFDTAHELDRLVLGTGNRTEICLGYTTWYGDGACSIDPVGELYKTEIRQFADLLGIPDAIREKKPSADLWNGQTDEGEIGVTYEQIDRLLRRVIDDGATSLSGLVADGFSAADIESVVALVNRNAFKRKMPDVAAVGRKAIPDEILLRQ